MPVTLQPDCSQVSPEWATKCAELAAMRGDPRHRLSLALGRSWMPERDHLLGRVNGETFRSKERPMVVRFDSGSLTEIWGEK